MVRNKQTSDRQTTSEGEIVHELRIKDRGVLDRSSQLSEMRVVIVVKKLFVLAVGAVRKGPIAYRRDVELKLEKQSSWNNR